MDKYTKEEFSKYFERELRTNNTVVIPPAIVKEFDKECRELIKPFIIAERRRRDAVRKLPRFYFD